jgi:hypothetical protein
VLKVPFGLIALCALAVLAVLALSCTPAHHATQPSAPAGRGGRPAAAAEPDKPRESGGGGQGSGIDGFFDRAESPIGIDYAPVRCAGNDPYWRPHHGLAVCSPQLGKAERDCDHGTSKCPSLCEQCYFDDLSLIKHGLRVNAITIYQPNYYILKAAQRLGMKVVVAVLNDSVLALATPASQNDCTYGGRPLYLCGANYASALIDGACVDTAGGDPFKVCTNRCSQRSNPARDCVNGDCSCQSDADCLGASNRCLEGAYLAPLNNPVSGQFLRDGTIIGLQLGNEFFGACEVREVPGQNQPCCGRNKETGQCRAWTVNRQVFSTAAQTMRQALDSRGLSRVKISVSLVQEQGPAFCPNGAPPPSVDYIAAHPYCNYVAEMPPMWTTLNGAECWDLARNHEFSIDQKACGASRTYIGETGYNSGCPLMATEKTMLNAEEDFVRAMVQGEPSCKGQPKPTPFPDFLFEFLDVCPPGGCLGGCGDPRQCSYNCCCKHKCSAQEVCGASCPLCVGNGYFGLYHTPGYGTDGSPLEPKFDPMPSLLCPAAQE